nr:unnamed protein product [Callosobruchus chinensis]
MSVGGAVTVPSIKKHATMRHRITVAQAHLTFPNAFRDMDVRYACVQRKNNDVLMITSNTEYMYF